jgi:hypothetical protein
LNSGTRDAFPAGSWGQKDWLDSTTAATAAATAAAAAAAAPEQAEVRINRDEQFKAGAGQGSEIYDRHDVAAAVAASEAVNGVTWLPWWQQWRCQVTLVVLLVLAAANLAVRHSGMHHTLH